MEPSLVTIQNKTLYRLAVGRLCIAAAAVSEAVCWIDGHAAVSSGECPVL
jgi:hypothetical protein